MKKETDRVDMAASGRKDNLTPDESSELDVLRRELAERARHQEVLSRLSQNALSGILLPVLFHHVREQVQMALNVSSCRLLELSPGTGWLAHGERSNGGSSNSGILPPGQGALASFAYSTQQMVVMADRTQEARFQAGVDYQAITSAVAVVIPGGIPAFGVLEVADDSPRVFQPYELNFLQSLVNLLGVVIERKKLESEAKVRNERLRLVMAASRDGVWDWNMQTDEVYWNDRLYEIIGLERKQALLSIEKVREHIHPDDLTRLQAMMEAHIHRNEPYEMQTRMRHASGAYRTVYVRGNVLKDGQGRAVRMLGLITDMSELLEVNLRLEESELRFRTLADSVPVFIGLTDPQGHALYYNKACQEFAGETSEELIENNWMRYVHQDDRQRLLDVYFAAIPQRKPFVFEYRIVGHNGEIRYLLNNGVPRFQTNGEFLGYALLGIDVTEERQYSARFQRVVDSNLLGIMFWRENGTVLEANDAYLNLMGLSRADLLAGKINWVEFDPEGPPCWDEGIHEQLAEKGVTRPFERRRLRPDGSFVDVMMGLATLEPGDLTQGLAFYLDMTEQKKATARIQRIMDANLVGILYTRSDGSILESNDAFLNMLGYSRADLEAGRLNFLTLTPPEYLEVSQQAIKSLTHTDVCEPFEKQYFHQDGHRVDALVASANLVPGCDSEHVVLVFNISARKIAQRALQRNLERERLTREILEIASRADNIEEVMRKAVQLIGRHFQADQCFPAYYAPLKEVPGFRMRISDLYLSSEAIKPFTFMDYPPELSRYIQEHFSSYLEKHRPELRSPEAFFQAVQASCEENHVPEPECERLLQTLRDRWNLLPIRSFVRLNIQYLGKLYGSLSLIHCGAENFWSDQDIAQLGDVVNYLGGAFYQMELRQQEQNALRELEKSYNLINLVKDAQAHFITSSNNQEMFRDLLNRLLTYTDSEYGFIGEVLDDATGHPYLKVRFITNIAWNEETRHLYAQNVASGMEFHNMDTLFGQVILTGQSVISNDPTNDSRSGGLPDGHPALNAFLGLPIYKGEEMVGMVGIANRPDGYDEALAEELRPYLLACANIIVNVRNELIRERLTQELTLSERALKSYASRLERSNKELEQFATIASHDLQTPLRKVMLFSDYLRASLGNQLADESRDYLERTQKATRKMQILITDLLALSRVNRKGQPFVPVDLDEIAQEVVADLEEVIRAAGGQVMIGEMMTIDADTTQLHQIFQNLIGNALKFHRPDTPPVVEVSAKAVSSQDCEIRVQDNGIGFDEKYLDRIFTVFERLHGENEFEGTGMGLAIVSKIVERHSGKVTARSAPGKGATFIVTLPIHQN